MRFTTLFRIVPLTTLLLTTNLACKPRKSSKSATASADAATDAGIAHRLGFIRKLPAGKQSGGFVTALGHLDNRYIFVGDSRGSITAYRADNQTPIASSSFVNRQKAPGQATSITVLETASGLTIAVGQSDGTIALGQWTVSQPQWQLQTIDTKHRLAINAIAFKDDGSQLVSASEDGSLVVWKFNQPNDLTSLELLGVLTNATQPNAPVTHAAFLANDILLASRNATLEAWNTNTRNLQILSLPTSSSRINHFDILASAPSSCHGGGSIAAVAQDKGEVVIVGLPYEELMKSSSSNKPSTIDLARYKLPNMNAAVNCHVPRSKREADDLQRYQTLASFSSLTGNAPKNLTLTKKGQIQATNAQMIRTQFSTDGRFVLTAAIDGTIMIWDARKLQHLRTLYAPGGMQLRVADFSATANQAPGVFFALEASNSTYLWDIKQMNSPFVLTTQGVNALASSAKSELYALASAAGTILAGSFSMIQSWQPHAESPPAITIASSSPIFSLSIAEPANQAPILLAGHCRGAFSLWSMQNNQLTPIKTAGAETTATSTCAGSHADDGTRVSTSQNGEWAYIFYVPSDAERSLKVLSLKDFKVVLTLPLPKSQSVEDLITAFQGKGPSFISFNGSADRTYWPLSWFAREGLGEVSEHIATHWQRTIQEKMSLLTSYYGGKNTLRNFSLLSACQPPAVCSFETGGGEGQFFDKGAFFGVITADHTRFEVHDTFNRVAAPYQIPNPLFTSNTATFTRLRFVGNRIALTGGPEGEGAKLWWSGDAVEFAP